MVSYGYPYLETNRVSPQLDKSPLESRIRPASGSQFPAMGLGLPPHQPVAGRDSDGYGDIEGYYWMESSFI
jgi:hypothetical protein